MTTVKRPMWVKCKPCGHHWICLWTPMLMSSVVDILKTIRCPMCGAGPKNVFTAEGPEVVKAEAVRHQTTDANEVKEI